MSLTKLALLTLLAAALLQAAPPVAVVSTGGALKINNKSIPTTGAPTWPLAKNDEVVTAADPAVITLPDGARFTMQANTRVVIRKCDTCVLALYEGALAYSMPDSSNAQVCALGHPINPAPRSEGKIVVESADRVVVQVAGKEQKQVASSGDCRCDAAAPWYAGRKAALIIAAAGGGAAAATIAVTKPDKKSKKKDENQQ